MSGLLDTIAWRLIYPPCITPRWLRRRTRRWGEGLLERRWPRWGR